jgi:hypothetical protein
MPAAARPVGRHPFSFSQDGDRRQSREAGFDGCLVKPVEMAALLPALETPHSK